MTGRRFLPNSEAPLPPNSSSPPLPHSNPPLPPNSGSPLHGGSGRLLRWLLSGVGAAFLLLYVVLAIQRLGYPYELEWMEGGIVDHITRVLAGERLYVAPSLDFIPFAYTPLYVYLSAAITSLMGPGFLAPRFLSLLASLGCYVLLYAFVRRETGSRFAAFLSAALFAAMFRLAGAWFDIARCDSLFLLFLLASAYGIRFGRTLPAGVAAGALAALAFLTKQTALPIMIPLLIYAFYADWRRALTVTLTLGVLLVASTLILDSLHDRWYRYYVFDLPGDRWQATPRAGKAAGFLLSDLLPALSIAIAYAILFFLHLWHGARRQLVFYLLFAAGMLGAAWISRLESGGYANVLFPAYACIAMLFGLGLHVATQLLRSSRSHAARIGEATLLIAAFLQFVSLTYNPRWMLPSATDRQAGKRLVAMLAQIPGEIWVPYHGYLPTLAEKQPHAHLMAINDILNSSPGEARSTMTENVAAALREQRFAAIILDSGLWGFEDLLAEHYEQTEEIFSNPNVFWPATGMRTRPEKLYTPRRD